MTRLDFQLRFHAPLLRATGYASEQYDATVDPDRPVSEDAIKGAMRHAASAVLEFPAEHVTPVFEERPDGSRWHWLVTGFDYGTSAADPETIHDPRTGVLHRVEISPETHTSLPDHLLRARTARLHGCAFAVIWLGPPESVRLADDNLLLRASAGAIQALGGLRRRGLGWTGTSIEITDAEVDTLIRWRNGQ